MLAGLQVSQRNDYPVTVKTGHSITEIIFSPTEIYSTSAEKPDVIIVLFQEGLKKILPEIQALRGEDEVWLSADLPEVETRARVRRIDLRAVPRWGRKSEYRALMAVSLFLRESGIYPIEAFRSAIELNPRYAEDNLAAVDAALTA
jgi:Pyruvate/2-oxoacid:ferredoxin oxidoreductase gamma subunit